MKKLIISIILMAIISIAFSQTYYSSSQFIGTLSNGIFVESSNTEFSYSITIDSLTVTLKDLEKNEVLITIVFEKIKQNADLISYELNAEDKPFVVHNKKEESITLWIPDGLFTFHFINCNY